MKRILSFLILTAVLTAPAACSSKKPPEQTAVKSKNILSVIRDLNTAYEKKSLDSFMAGVAPGFPERELFSRSLVDVFSKYETIRFNIQYTKMIIMIEDKGQIKASFNWDAEWLAAGGLSQKNGGRVTLVFEPGTFKLRAIDGKNPFLPQASETPGTKQ